MEDEIETGEAIAEEIGEAVEEALAEPIAAAVEAQADAEEMAEQIAAAAMESARMQRVEAVEKGLAECLTTLETLPILLADQFRPLMEAQADRIAALEMRLAASEAAPPVPVIVTPEAPSSELIPPPLAMEIQPEALTPPPPESAVVLPVRKRNRFL